MQNFIYIDLESNIEHTIQTDIFEHMTKNTMVTESEARTFIDNPENSPEAKATISDLLTKYEKARHQYKGVTMVINRLGKGCLWID